MKKDDIQTLEMLPMKEVIQSSVKDMRKKYQRCARGTRRSKKYHYCRSLMRKKCGKSMKRNRKTGKCESTSTN